MGRIGLMGPMRLRGCEHGSCCNGWAGVFADVLVAEVCLMSFNFSSANGFGERRFLVLWFLGLVCDGL